MNDFPFSRKFSQHKVYGFNEYPVWMNIWPDSKWFVNSGKHCIFDSRVYPMNLTLLLCICVCYFLKLFQPKWVWWTSKFAFVCSTRKTFLFPFFFDLDFESQELTFLGRIHSHSNMQLNQTYLLNPIRSSSNSPNIYNNNNHHHGGSGASYQSSFASCMGEISCVHVNQSRGVLFCGLVNGDVQHFDLKRLQAQWGVNGDDDVLEKVHSGAVVTIRSAGRYFACCDVKTISLWKFKTLKLLRVKLGFFLSLTPAVVIYACIWMRERERGGLVRCSCRLYFLLKSLISQVIKLS